MSDRAENLKKRVQGTLQLGRALHFVWKSSKGLSIVNGLLVALQGLLPILPLYLMKLLVEALTGTYAAPDIRQVLFLVSMIGAVTLFSATIRSISGLVSEEQAAIITDHMNDVIHAKSIEVDLEYYESSQYYDTLHRAQREAPFRPTKIVNGLVQLGINGVSILAVTGLLFSFHWSIAIVILASVIPGIAVRLLYADNMYQWQRKRTSNERYADFFNWILTGNTHAKEVRLFDLGPLFMARFRDLRGNLRREKLDMAIKRSIAELVAQTSATVAIYGSCAFVAYRTLQGTNTLGDMIMYYQAFQRLQGFLQGMLGTLAGLYEDNLFISNLYEFLDIQPQITEPACDRPIPQPVQTGIALNHVSFKYSPGTKTILDDISLTIRSGEVVAFVGENGSGKTTLIKLLCRLYDPASGNITLDGTDLREFRTKTLRRAMTVIFQDYAHYELTARENIWVGNSILPPDHESIFDAARRSGADEVITALPRGYDTVLGNRFENGQELSIGEWQKVALARAFTRDAQIIVLDEPTSSMDTKAEYEVFRNFRRLTEGRTAIIISHRFSTVRMADRIYVLKSGKIIEGGTHDELMALGGDYARAFEIQAHQYR
ncbi:MAG: ABC transporter ATP-binding protein [Candidatus Riflebacteria bacterium]|nr:ABC transporter ATP-binding protein [Candidatus Riflebacteria bacterium]